MCAVVGFPDRRTTGVRVERGGALGRLEGALAPQSWSLDFFGDAESFEQLVPVGVLADHGKIFSEKLRRSHQIRTGRIISMFGA